MAVTLSVADTIATLTGALTITGALTVTSGTITGITDLVVADGGTGVSTLTDGGILLGSGTGAITAMDVLAAGELIYGDGTTDPAVLAAGATTTILVGGGAAAPVWTTATGSGAPVRQTSPTLVTPVLDTPTSGNLTNCTGPFGDGTAIIKGSVDATKLLRIEVDGFTTGTTRVVTPPDRNINLGITLGTEQASTSGTSIDFTGIPAGVRRITVMFIGVSTNGTTNILIQLGDAGGFETSGYTSNSVEGANVAASTAGFLVTNGIGTGSVQNGHVTLNLENSAAFTWTQSGLLIRDTIIQMSAGSKSLSAELTQVRITMVNGTDAFDLGVINISHEF